MIFATPVDAAFLDGGFYETSGTHYYTSVPKLAADFSPVRFRREIALLRRHCPAGRILDVGCGTGAFLHQLQTRYPNNYTATGLDVSGPALAHAAAIGLTTTSARFARPEFAPEPFDAITFWAVFEHVGEPLAFLRKAVQLLRPNGVCCVLVPNMQSLAVGLLGSRYRYIMPEHINAFTRKTLRRLIAAVPEFAVIEFTSSHFNPVVIWQDLWRPRHVVPAAERAQLLTRTNAWKTNPLLRPLQRAYQGIERLLGAMGIADNLVVVLRRRAPTEMAGH